MALKITYLFTPPIVAVSRPFSKSIPLLNDFQKLEFFIDVALYHTAEQTAKNAEAA